MTSAGSAVRRGCARADRSLARRIPRPRRRRPQPCVRPDRRFARALHHPGAARACRTGQSSPARVAGFRKRAIGYRDRQPLVEIEWRAIFCIDPEVDRVDQIVQLRIEGDTTIDAQATGSFLVIRIPRPLHAPSPRSSSFAVCLRGLPTRPASRCTLGKPSRGFQPVSAAKGEPGCVTDPGSCRAAWSVGRRCPVKAPTGSRSLRLRRACRQ